MITEEEFNDYNNTGFSFFTSFILIPAVTITFNLFGYINFAVIILEVALIMITFISFLRRYLFLHKHRKFINNKNYYFQNISFILLMIWNIFSGFLPYYVDKDDDFFIKYHLIDGYNLYILIPLIIFSFILFTFMTITAKRVSKLISNGKIKYEKLENND